MLSERELAAEANTAQRSNPPAQPFIQRFPTAHPSATAVMKRWSAGRKKQVVLRLLRGESADAISREAAVPIFRLEEWRDRALAGIDVGLKERDQAEGRRTAEGWSRAQRGMRHRRTERPARKTTG